jgi:hypothetical protein
MYRIKAWGSEEHPDLDYCSKTVPDDLRWKYPRVDVQRLTPIPKDVVLARLES